MQELQSHANVIHVMATDPHRQNRRHSAVLRGGPQTRPDRPFTSAVVLAAPAPAAQSAGLLRQAIQEGWHFSCKRGRTMRSTGPPSYPSSPRMCFLAGGGGGAACRRRRDRGCAVDRADANLSSGCVHQCRCEPVSPVLDLSLTPLRGRCWRLSDGPRCLRCLHCRRCWPPSPSPSPSLQALTSRTRRCWWSSQPTTFLAASELLPA